LLIAVNVPLALALAILLTLDYRREMSDAIAQKHASLTEEAMMVYHGLYYLAQNDRPQAVQRFINSVCGHIQESRSPGHHIAVRWQGGVLQAQLHHAEPQGILRTMQKAAESPDYLASIGDETLVVGRFSGRGVDVLVSEHTTSIRRSIRGNILFHLMSLVVLAFAAAAIVNLVLSRMVARPIRRLSKVVGRIAAGEYGIHVDRFKNRELNGLSDAIHTMSESLFLNEQERRAQMAQARRIQEHLLPSAMELPGLTVARLFAPANTVAGDYYDLIPLADGTWLICVADVTGHGIPAALGSVILKTILLVAAERFSDPGQILQYANQRLAVLLPDHFASMFLGRWNHVSSQLQYASAGHEPGLHVLLDGTVRPLNATGPLLGIDEMATWDTTIVDLSSGERILLTTDGVAEACGLDSQLFGRDALTRLAAGSAGLSPEDSVRLIQGAVSGHQAGEPPTDDVTILLMEVKSSPHQDSN